MINSPIVVNSRSLVVIEKNKKSWMKCYIFKKSIQRLYMQLDNDFVLTFDDTANSKYALRIAYAEIELG